MFPVSLKERLDSSSAAVCTVTSLREGDLIVAGRLVGGRIQKNLRPTGTLQLTRIDLTNLRLGKRFAKVPVLQALPLLRSSLLLYLCVKSFVNIAATQHKRLWHYNLV